MVAEKLVRRFTYPAERPIISITLYYVAVILVGAGLLWAFPALRQVVGGERLARMAQEGNPFTSTATQGDWISSRVTLSLAASMLGSFILMIPASWVYMATRRKKGFDQTIVQTMVVLALAVAGVIVIVRNSLALAFGLAGIVGAIRFRNSLPDTRDMLYIFLAIGVGLAAGVEALAAALVLSAIFNYVVLFMHRLDYGMCELGRPAGHLLLTASMLTPPNGPLPGSEAGARKKKDGYNSVLLVRTATPDPAQRAVEPFLAREFKRWRLAEIETNRKGNTVLKYLVRLNKRVEPQELEDALLEVGAPYVLGAKVH